MHADLRATKQIHNFSYVFIVQDVMCRFKVRNSSGALPETKTQKLW